MVHCTTLAPNANNGRIIGPNLWDVYFFHGMIYTPRAALCYEIVRARSRAAATARIANQDGYDRLDDLPFLWAGCSCLWFFFLSIRVHFLTDQPQGFFDIAAGSLERVGVNRQRRSEHNQRRAVFGRAHRLLNAQPADRLYWAGKMRALQELAAQPPLSFQFSIFFRRRTGNPKPLPIAIGTSNATAGRFEPASSALPHVLLQRTFGFKCSKYVGL